MDKERFKKLKFSERQALTRGKDCLANWQVESVQGAAFYVSCRVCGTELSAGCTPKCLMEVTEEKLGELLKPDKSTDPRDNPLIGDDSWIHDVDMGAR